MSIGERIRDYRKKVGLSQKELGKILEVSQQHIAQYESGKRTPKLDTIQKIAAALQVDVNTLLEFDYLDESPIYRTFKRTGDAESELFLEHKKHLLTKGIDLQAVDIEMLKKFKNLNELGQSKAIDYVEDISKLSEYQKKNEPNKEK